MADVTFEAIGSVDTEEPHTESMVDPVEDPTIQSPDPSPVPSPEEKIGRSPAPTPQPKRKPGRPKGSANKTKPAPPAPPKAKARAPKQAVLDDSSSSSEEDQRILGTLMQDDMETQILSFLTARKKDQAQKRHTLWTNLASSGLR